MRNNNRQKLIERKRKKRKRKQNKKHSLFPPLHIDIQAQETVDLSMVSAITASIPEITKIFWEELFPETKRDLIRWWKERLKSTNEASFAQALGDILNQMVKRVNDQYGCNYSTRIYSSRILRFKLIISCLETESTKYGKVHILPDVRFPTNQRLGLSTHAIDRLDVRLFDGKYEKLGPILTLPIVMIPYMDDMYALYASIKQGVNLDGELHPATIFALLGYVPIQINHDLMVGVTLYKPGFNKTPEKGFTDDAINSKFIFLALHDNKLFKLDKQQNKTIAFTALPHEEWVNPNLGMLINLGDLIQSCSGPTMLSNARIRSEGRW